jgi:hypothetical protein
MNAMGTNRKRRNKAIGITLLSLVIIGGAAYATWSIVQLRRDNADLRASLSQTTEELATLKRELVDDPSGTVAGIQQERTAAILEKVSQLYAIPEGQNPTIATVQDVDKLKDQPFFEAAQNGDYLIVFDESSLAILYRPTENRLVKVGPINIENSVRSLKPIDKIK